MNLEEEIRDNYTISVKMKQVWEVQMDISKKIFEICNKYQLKIVCCGGTAIGALRHHGYIPWDDDIDLAMLRDDYDKLCSVAKDEFKDPYFFQTAYTDKGYCYGHAQVRKNGTTAILKGDVFNEFHLGIFVDIFVLDAVPMDQKKIMMLRKKTEHIRKDMNIKAFFRFGYAHPIRHFTNYLRYLWLIPKDLKSLFSNYEECFRETNIDDCDEVAGMAFTWNNFEKVKRTKHLMDEIIWMPFEDMFMPVSSMCDSILRKQYGDYMKPVKAPSMHGDFLVLDPDKDYKEYLPELRRQAKKDFWKKVLVKLHLKK